ncbi:MAG TPA: glycosyltransferase family 39 protein [Bryobacteraceae bacterium]|nr:glycosyltransferase family 39 protein [Bryobacteraceae bacterium]
MNPGGAPIWYLTQALAIRVMGFSPLSARLPAWIASIASCWGLALLARRAGARWPALYLAVFALFPLQLRYALEGRPYSEALCFSIWATIVFLRLLERPKLIHGLLYCLLVALGLYTQPYSIFVPVAQAIWALANPRVPVRARLLALAAVSVAGAVFVPWFVYARQNWPSDLAPGVRTTLQPRILLLVLRECLGGGYPLSVPAILAVIAGTRSQVLRPPTKAMLVLMILLPIGGALWVDYLFGYFVAIRQMIFILPGIALLAGGGVEYIAAKLGGSIEAAFALLILTTSLVYDVRWLMRPREDWKTATTALRRSVDSGACALLAPERTAQIFLFFDPGLLHRLYSEASDFSQCPRVAVAVLPRDLETSTAIARRLSARGFRQSQVIFAGEPAVRLFSRPE